MPRIFVAPVPRASRAAETMDAAVDSDRVSLARIAGSGMNLVLNVAAVTE